MRIRYDVNGGKLWELLCFGPRKRRGQALLALHASPGRSQNDRKRLRLVSEENSTLGMPLDGISTRSGCKVTARRWINFDSQKMASPGPSDDDDVSETREPPPPAPATPATPPPTPPVVTERAKEPRMAINLWALKTYGDFMILNAALEASPTGPATNDITNATMNLLTRSWKAVRSVHVSSKHTDQDEGTEPTHPHAATSNSAVGSEFQALMALKQGTIAKASQAFDNKGIVNLSMHGAKAALLAKYPMRKNDIKKEDIDAWLHAPTPAPFTHIHELDEVVCLLHGCSSNVFIVPNWCADPCQAVVDEFGACIVEKSAIVV